MLERKRFAKRLSVGLSALVMAGSALTLVGWASGARRLTDWFDLDISQLPNNAVGVLAGGAATLLMALGYRRVSAMLALVTGLIGGATLLEHLAGIDLGVDALLLTHDWGHSATRVPGRMGVPGSTSLLLTGAAIFLSMPERTRGWAAAGGVLVIAIALVSIIGYALQARLFYTLPHLTTIALQTAVLLLALGIALVAAIPDRLPARLLVEDSAAALLVLSSLPGIVLVPMLIGWLSLEGERAGLFDTAFATAAMVLVLIFLLIALLWRTAHGVQRYERALRESQGRLSAMLGSITDAFMTLDPEWRYTFVNDHSATHWGLSRETMLGSTVWEKFPDAVGTDAYRQMHVAMQRRTTVEYEYFHAPMNKWYGSRAYPTENGGLAVYSRDISESKWGDQQRNARLAVTQVLGQAGETKEVARDVLHAVCENLGWDVGFFWTVTDDGQALACLGSWHRPELVLAEFEVESCKHRFQSGEGIPGRVWASGQPIWLRDLSLEPDLPRAAQFASNGLHSALASPIVVGGQILGVIEFFTHRLREMDPGLVELMGTVSGSVGQFMQRRRAEEARSASADRLSLALAAADLGDWSWDAASDRVTLSDRATEAFGIVPGADITSAAMRDLVHPADRERVMRELKRVVADRDQYDITYQVNRSEGQQVWLGVLGRADYDAASDQVVGMYGVIQDITDRKVLEESLRSSEERLRLALDAGGMGVWDWNVRTGEIKWSDSMEPLHGLAPGTFEGTLEHFQQLIHPDDREAVNAAIAQALETGGEFCVEFRNVWQNGGIHWIASSGKVFPGDDGQPLRMIGIGLDVTRRKRAEETARFLADASAALAELEDFDSTLQKVSSLAVPSFADWATVDVVEADGSLRRVSVTHIDPAKVQLAHEVHRRFPPEPGAPQGAWNILSTGQSEIVPEITDELLVQSIKDEERLGIIRQLGLRSYIGVPLTVRGKTLAVITFILAESGHRYDRTDLAVAEDLASRTAIAVENSQLYLELRQADQRKDEFLATLAHELRNPLAPISNGMQVLRMSGGSGEMADEARSMMERQLRQMVRLVDDLLDVSRITRNNLELRKERVSLAAVIDSAVETSRPLVEQAGHTLSITLPPAPVYLDADPTRLAQVFSNLLNNAAKYTEPGGRITLTGKQSGDDVVVEVQDNGMGIPGDALPRIFEMFSQVDRNMERAQGGLGIGLSLVQRLVELHCGTIEARSDGPGLGSQFVVRLPTASATQSAATSPSDLKPLEMARRRILVVDDNYDSANSLSVMLELMGNETHSAHDGLAAIEAAEAFRPNLILLDIGLPKLNGYDACRRIREQPWSQGMVIVALTGWGQDEDRRLSNEAGFDEHLVKPADIAEIMRLLAVPNP